VDTTAISNELIASVSVVRPSRDLGLRDSERRILCSKFIGVRASCGYQVGLADFRRISGHGAKHITLAPYGFDKRGVCRI